MIIDKNFIDNYFKQYIFNFMYPDIGNCIKAKANFAVATLLVAYSEKIGALVNGNLGKSGTSQKLMILMKKVTFCYFFTNNRTFKMFLQFANIRLISL